MSIVYTKGSVKARKNTADNVVELTFSCVGVDDTDDLGSSMSGKFSLAEEDQKPHDQFTKAEIDAFYETWKTNKNAESVIASSIINQRNALTSEPLFDYGSLAAS